jgi:hypothetical protein
VATPFNPDVFTIPFSVTAPSFVSTSIRADFSESDFESLSLTLAVIESSDAAEQSTVEAFSAFGFG